MTRGLRERMRVLSLHGISHDVWERQGGKDNWEYDVVECGFKYNMSDLTAAIGLVQLARLDEMNRRRAAIAPMYNAAFAGMPELELPPEFGRFHTRVAALHRSVQSRAPAR